jgi:hypothetical protein
MFPRLPRRLGRAKVRLVLWVLFLSLVFGLSLASAFYLQNSHH